MAHRNDQIGSQPSEHSAVRLARKRSVWIAVGLAVVSAAVYGQTVTYDFINYDDPVYVTNHRLVRQGLTLEGLRAAFTEPHAYNWHPLTTLSHMLDCSLFGPDGAGGHHAVNVLLHAAAAAVLFLVLEGMTAATWPAALVAALFALHPLGVESVAWISERKNTLSTLLWFLAMGAYLRYARKPGWGSYGLVALVMALGIMSKQMLVTLPCALLLLDYWPLKRHMAWSGTSKRNQRATADVWLRLAAEKIPLLAISAAGSAAVLWAQGSTQLALPLIVRVENALITCVAYLGKFFWPVNLVVYYPHRAGGLPPDEMAAALAAPALGAALILLVISVVALIEWRRRPYLIVGWLWYLGTLVPVLGLVQVGSQAMADRYMYVPLVGLSIMIAWSLADAVERFPAWRRAVVTATACCLVLLALMTVGQVQHWRDTKTLFTHVLDVDADNHVAHHLVAESLIEERDYQSALAHLETAIRLRPGEPRPHVTLGYLLYRLGRHAAALESFNRGLALFDSYAVAYNGRGLVYRALGDHQRALADMRRAVELAPYSNAARSNLEELLGHIALGRGDLDSAQQHLLRASELAPDSETPWVFLGMIANSQGRPRDAIEAYRRALELAPDSAEAAVNLANLLLMTPDAELRNAAEAVRLAERACQLTGYRHPTMLNTLAVAYEAAGRAADAVRIAEQACELTGYRTPALVNTLAGAYDAAGRLEDAVQLIEDALQLEDLAPGDIEQLENNLTYFREKLARRDS